MPAAKSSGQRPPIRRSRRDPSTVDPPGSGPGRTFGLGGLLAVAGGVVGMAVTAPTGQKLGTLGAALGAAGRPPTPDELATMQSLQRRLATAAALVAVLVVLATVAMAVARYVS